MSNDAERRHTDLLEAFASQDAEFNRLVNAADQRADHALTELAEQQKAFSEVQADIAVARANVEVLRAQLSQNPAGKDSNSLDSLQRQYQELQNAYHILKLDSDNIMSRHRDGKLVN